MKRELMEQLEGYADVTAEIENSLKSGTDFNEHEGEVFRYVNAIHPSLVELKVAEIIEETHVTKTLRLKPVEGILPPFQAGQYIALHVDTGKIKTSRPYSISSSPTEKSYWDITVQRVEQGLVSNFLLDEITPGNRLFSSGPQGVFCYNPLIHDDTIVCLAGGSGVTPFLSMIRNTIARGLNQKIILLYGAKEIRDAIFFEVLSELSVVNENIDFFPVFENPPEGFKGPSGYLTADIITRLAGNLKDRTLFVCGPQAMYDFILEQLSTLNVPGRKIRREMYGAPAQPWNCEGWPSEISGDETVTIRVNGEKSFTSRSGISLMNAMENNGLLVPAVCRSGECSMCRVKLLEGKVFQPKGTLLRKSDRMFGFIHSCVSYPLTDLEIRT